MVKMLQTAKYGGKQYEVDGEYSVDKGIERFWIKNGIAKQSDTDLFDEPPTRRGRSKAEKAEQGE